MRYSMFRLLVKIYWIFLLLSFFWVLAHGDHTPATQWTREFKSADGVPCCNMGIDCREAPVRMLRVNGETVTMEIDGEVVDLPEKSVHQSPTMHSAYCLRFGIKPTADTVRCAFFVVGG